MKKKNKVTIVYYDVQDEIANETMWIEKSGEYYKLMNSPFFAPNLAFNDIISVEDDDGVLYFEDIIENSGHSTIQIIIFEKSQIKRVLNQLENFGCKWEGMDNQKYIALDIPPNIDYKIVEIFLTKELNNKNLDFKEACLGQQ